MSRYKRMTPQQRAVYHALRELGGVMVVLPQDARPLHALRRRGLVRFGRDEHGVKLARLRVTRAQQRVTRRTARRFRYGESMYGALVGGAWIPEVVAA